jgi:hypothetical protein
MDEESLRVRGWPWGVGRWPLLSLVTVLLSVWTGLVAFGQRPPWGPSPAERGVAPRRPPAGVPGPWDQDVLVFRVSAGGEVTKVAVFERAGVPTLARMTDGRLIAAHQHFPEDDEASFDKVAVRFSSDEGRQWSGPQTIRLSGLPERMRFPFDPTLVVLPDGRVRLFFTSLRANRFEEDLPGIHSAISTNGVDYEYEPGIRFGIKGRPVIDCAVVLHQGVFHLYAPDNGPRRRPGEGRAEGRPGVGYHATSKDGLRFTRAEDVRIEGRRRWLGSAQSDGKRIKFFGTGGGPGTPGARPPGSGVWVGSSRDGQTWELIEWPPIPGADPGAVRSSGGGWVVVATGPPRPGTPSAEPKCPGGPRWQPRKDFRAWEEDRPVFPAQEPVTCSPILSPCGR